MEIICPSETLASFYQIKHYCNLGNNNIKKTIVYRKAARINAIVEKIA
jgi:hypothetical protein